MHIILCGMHIAHASVNRMWNGTVAIKLENSEWRSLYFPGGNDVRHNYELLFLLWIIRCTTLLIIAYLWSTSVHHLYTVPSSTRSLAFITSNIPYLNRKHLLSLSSDFRLLLVLFIPTCMYNLQASPYVWSSKYVIGAWTTRISKSKINKHLNSGRKSMTGWPALSQCK